MKKSWIEMTPDERIAAREFAAMLVGAKNYVYVNDKRDKDSKSLTEDELLIKIMKGLELGFSPMQALDSLYNERGKLTLHAEAMLALAWSSGEMTHFEIARNDKTGCWIKIGRNGMEPVEVSFTEADAKAAGLLGKAGNWTTRTVLMYRHRAVSKAVRMMFADKTQGLYMTGELSESDFYEEGGEADRIYSKELGEMEGDKVIEMPKQDRRKKIDPVQYPAPDKEGYAPETEARKDVPEPVEEDLDDAIDSAMDKVTMPAGVPAADLYPGQTDESLKADIKELMNKHADLITKGQFKNALEAESLSVWSREKHGEIIDKMTTLITQEKLKVMMQNKPAQIPGNGNGNGNGHAKKVPVVDDDFELDMYEKEEAEDTGFSSRKAK